MRKIIIHNHYARDAGAVRIVHNKLLGGWYVVRGSSDTPLSGKFPSKEAAQAWLDQRAAKDNEKPSPEKIRTLYKSWTSGGQKPSEAIGELADNFGMSEGEVKRIVQGARDAFMLGPVGEKEDREAGRRNAQSIEFIKTRGKWAKENLAYFKSEYKRNPTRANQERIAGAQADIEKMRNAPR